MIKSKLLDVSPVLPFTPQLIEGKNIPEAE